MNAHTTSSPAPAITSAAERTAALAADRSMMITVLQSQYRLQQSTPAQCVARLLARIDAADRPEIWISRVDPVLLHQQAAALSMLLEQEGEAVFARLPLFGIPFAVKDNIDVADMPTTAACPAFSFTPARSATVVERLQAAGALLIGKTNLDQFATGLVGTRSPFGAVRNAIDPAIVSGGSSSGSAVAVALGLVSFSLGTDTAGSGRVPAGLNGIVGLKPSRGLISTRGVFPACRTLDCVSIFARSVADAWQVLGSAAGYDAEDAYSRRLPMLGILPRALRIAVPAAPEFHGDREAEQAFAATITMLESRDDCRISRIDYTPFRQAAELLYQGPWVAERLAAVGNFHATHHAAMDPVVASIIGQGALYSAVDAFNGQYRLADLRRQAENALVEVDLLLLPTNPTMPGIADLAAAPVQRNAELGYYTNFVNFFDMAALAVPSVARACGMPAGVTLVGPCGADHRLAAIAERLFGMPDDVNSASVALQPLAATEPTIILAVVGAHLLGQPLNWQLQERGARKVADVKTAARYRLYALAGTTPAKPGLVRVDDQSREQTDAAAKGQAIALELWALPLRRFGEFVADVPPPLAIGSLELDDGRWVMGFVCESTGIVGATDISRFGGWRAYLASRQR